MLVKLKFGNSNEDLEQRFDTSAGHIPIIFGCRFDSPVRQHSFMEIVHETISAAILPLLLIQEGQLSVTGERMFTNYWIRLPRINFGYQIASTRSNSSRLSQLQFNILNVYANWPTYALYLYFAFLM